MIAADHPSGNLVGRSRLERIRDPDTPMLDQGYEYRPLRIGEDATVMSKCTVFSDVGERAFVGANSVVSRPVPAHTLAVGSPARPIDNFAPPE